MTAELTEAARWQREACEAAAGSPERGRALAQLWKSLAAAFNGDPENLDVAEEAVRLVSAVKASQPLPIDLAQLLGTALLVRWEQRKDEVDLRAAVDALHAALESVPGDLSAPPDWYSTLGSALTSLHRYSHDERHLAAAIQFHEESVRAERAGLARGRESRLAQFLSRLGNTYRTRFDAYGAVDDIRAAVRAFREAIEAEGEHGFEFENTLNNLGTSLVSWFQLEVDRVELIDEAIAHFEAADRLVPGDAVVLDNLSAGLQERYDTAKRARPGTEQPGDVARALRLRRRLLRATPPDSPVLPIRLNNLGQSVLARYLLTRRQAYRTIAIALFRRADDSGPERLAAYPLNLALALSAGEDPEDRLEATDRFREACLMALRQDLRIALTAAGLWAGDAERRHAWAEAAEALAHASSALDQLLGRQASRQDQLSWLRHGTGVSARWAFALAAGGDAAGAVARLEANGRYLTHRLFGLGRPPEVSPPGRCTVVYLASTQSGGLALIARPTGEGEVAVVWLPLLSVDTVYEMLVPYGASYSRWIESRSVYLLETWHWALSTLSQWLGQAVMEPVLRALGPVPEVVLVPIGPVAGLPLHAAWTGEVGAAPADRRYLCDAMVVGYAPNAASTSLLSPADGALGGDALVVADPQPVAQAVLPAVSDEASGVASVFETPTLLPGPTASREAVLAALPHCSVAHFACHGRANYVEPLHSHLLMADDVPLTVEDLLACDLTAVRLAVLSACETGLGNVALPDDTLSLPNGLLAAGAPGVVASLWPVDDRSTALLMMRFYRSWRVDGLTPAEALHRAQLWLRDSSREEKLTFLEALHGGNPPVETDLAAWQQDPLDYAAPHYWAAFIHVGA